MVRSVISAAVFVLLAASSHAGLDFTPFGSFYEVDGIRVPNLNFHENGKVIAYTPPPGWKPSGRGGRLELLPPQAVQAGGGFTVLRTAPLAAETSKLEAFRELATALLPPEATKVEIVDAQVSCLHVSGQPGVEVLLQYTFFAQQFKKSILFVPRDRDILSFSFTARPVDFAPLEESFRRSLYSFQGL